MSANKRESSGERRLLDALTAVIIVFSAYALSGVLATAWAQDSSETVRREFSKPLTAAQSFLKDKKHTEVLKALAETDSVADKSPYESYIIEQIRGSAAVALGDAAQAERSYELVLRSARVAPGDRQAMAGNLAILFFRVKDYPRAITWGRRHLAEGGGNPQIKSALVSSLYLGGDFAGAASELQTELQSVEAVGKVPAEERYKLLASCQLKLKDEAGYVAVLEKLVQYYPSKEYWLDLVSRVQRRNGFSERLWIDGYRLQRSVGALLDPEDIVEFVALDIKAGFPAEAVRVLSESFSSGALGIGVDADKHRKLQAQVLKAVEADRKSLNNERAPGADAGVMVNSGFNLVLHDQFEPGLAMMEQGVAKGDALKFKEDAKLRLAVAYVLARQKDKAVKAFKDVGGADGTADLARLWLIHVQRASP